MENFEIRILSQHWLEFNNAERLDLCSHGKILLKINKVEITNEKDEIEWGISETALSLLRSVVYDYPYEGRDDTVIFHGCGTVLMMGCPIRITWNTIHKGEKVILRNFKKYPTTNENDVIIYPDLEVTLDSHKYATKVYKFANEVKQFFKVEKSIEDDFDIKMYRNFWDEFDELLARVREKVEPM